MTTGRSNHTATLLASGKVLVLGGDDGSGGVASPELYDPATDTWSSAGSLTTGRTYHTATLLANGKVLVAGGGNITSGSSVTLASAELYDPATNTWSSAASMTTARVFHTATLLANGKVLVLGGEMSIPLASAELYNPTTNTWSSAGSMTTPRASHTATLLTGGKVLVVGGNGGPVYNLLASVELSWRW